MAAETALIYLFYRNPSRALPRARRALTGPDQYYPWLLLARCQQALGLDTQARRSLQTCLELCPGHEEGRQLLAEVAGFRVLGGTLAARPVSAVGKRRKRPAMWDSGEGQGSEHGLDVGEDSARRSQAQRQRYSPRAWRLARGEDQRRNSIHSGRTAGRRYAAPVVGGDRAAEQRAVFEEK